MSLKLQGELVNERKRADQLDAALLECTKRVVLLSEELEKEKRSNKELMKIATLYEEEQREQARPEQQNTETQGKAGICLIQ